LEKKGKKHHCISQTAKTDKALQRLHIPQDFKKHLMLLKALKPFTFSGKRHSVLFTL
jgi:hypothetical protein